MTRFTVFTGCKYVAVGQIVHEKLKNDFRVGKKKVAQVGLLGGWEKYSLPCYLGWQPSR